MSSPLQNTDGFQNSFIHTFLQSTPSANKIKDISEPASHLVKTSFFGQKNVSALPSFIADLDKLSAKIRAAINDIKFTAAQDISPDREHHLEGRITDRLTQLFTEKNLVTKGIATNTFLFKSYDTDYKTYARQNLGESAKSSDIKNEVARMRADDAELHQAKLAKIDEESQPAKIHKEVERVKIDIRSNAEILIKILLDGKNIESPEKWFDTIKNNQVEINAIHKLTSETAKGYADSGYSHLIPLKKLVTEFLVSKGHVSPKQAEIQEVVNLLKTGSLDIKRLSNSQRKSFSSDDMLLGFEYLKKGNSEDKKLFSDIFKAQSEVKRYKG